MTYLPRLVRNTATLFINRIFISIINFIVGIYMMRYLGAKLLGEYSTVFAFLAFFSVFTTVAGIDQILVREVSKGTEGEEFRKKIATAVSLRLLLGGVGFLIAAGSSRYLYSGSPVAIYIFFSSFSLLFSLHENNSPFVVHYNARLDLFVPQFLMTVVHSISALLKLLFVFGIHASLLAFILLDAMVPVAVSLLFLGLHRRSSGERMRWKDVSWPVAKYFVRESAPLFFCGFFIMVYMRIDQILISKWLGAEALGNYSVAVRIAEAFNFVPVYIAVSLLPLFSKTLADDNKDEVYGFAFRVLNLFVFPMILFFSLFPREAINLLFPGQFPDSSGALRVLVWSEFFVFAGVIHANILLAAGRQKYDLIFITLQAAVNLFLNVYLIPRFSIVGASWASVCSYGLGFVVAMFIPNVRPYTKIMFRSSWKFIVVSLATYWAGASMPAVPRIFLGIFSVMMLLLLGMEKRDFPLLTKIWKETKSMGRGT